MAGQKRQDKRSYLHDFKQNGNGSYVYTGMTWYADPALRRRMLVKAWALQAVMLLAALLPGFVTTAGLLNTFYVIIPYVFWLISDFVLAYMLGGITFGGNPLKDYVYKRSVAGYAVRAAFPLAGAALTALALAVFFLQNGSGAGGGVCFACCGVQIGASVIAIRIRIADIWTC